ncbi:MAG TPA: hypothetical protein VFE54_09840 [Mucilaginibacter sp.]|nr:hypothetical protein [Mucilaginibacter sp.]
MSATPQAIYANADVKSDKSSDHPPPNALTTPKQAEADTSWKPVRRLWGYAFGDFYYNAHADVANRGGETNYNGVPTYRNSFQFRRIYLGYEYDINKKFTAEVYLHPNLTQIRLFRALQRYPIATILQITKWPSISRTLLYDGKVFGMVPTW